MCILPGTKLCVSREIGVIQLLCRKWINKVRLNYFNYCVCFKIISKYIPILKQDEILSKRTFVQGASSIQKVRCLKISCISGIFWWRIIFQLRSCISGLVFPDLFLVLNNFSITYSLQSLCILLQTRVNKGMSCDHNKIFLFIFPIDLEKKVYC